MDIYTDQLDFEALVPVAGIADDSTAGDKLVVVGPTASCGRLLEVAFEKPQRDWSDERIRQNLIKRGFDRDQQNRYLNKWHEVRGDRRRCKP